jgi:folate-binding protein YgfZ
MNQWICLASRSVIALSGKEAPPFLQGLVTQNVMRSFPQFTALLTPQGRFHSDFFIIPYQDGLLLECDKKHHASLLALLKRFSVFHPMMIEDLSSVYSVCVGLGPYVRTMLSLLDAGLTVHDNGMLFYPDPRTPDMGVRALVPYKVLSYLPHPLLLPSPEENYHYDRLGHIVPEGAYDLIVDKSIILEYNYHTLGALCWEKGCYMGQELMARTFHRGEIRKKPYGLKLVEGSFPDVGTDLFYQGERLGVMGSHCRELGLACLYRAQMQVIPASGSMQLTWGGAAQAFTVALYEHSIAP